MSIRLSLLAAVAASTLACAPSVADDSAAPPSVVDTGMLPKVVSSIVADDQNVFWWGSFPQTSSTRTVVAQRPASGGPVVVLADATNRNLESDPHADEPPGPAVYGVWINHSEVFWLQNGRSQLDTIASCPIGGGLVRVVAHDISMFVVDDDNVYGIRGDSYDGNDIVSISLTTGAETTLASGNFDRIALADGGQLLVVDESFELLPRAGGAATTVAKAFEYAAGGTSNGVVIFSSYTGDSYACTPSNNGCAELFVATGISTEPRLIGFGPNFALDDDAVYSVESDGLQRASLVDGARTILASGVPTGDSVAVNRSTVFWPSNSETDPTSATFIQQAPIR